MIAPPLAPILIPIEAPAAPEHTVLGEDASLADGSPLAALALAGFVDVLVAALDVRHSAHTPSDGPGEPRDPAGAVGGLSAGAATADVQPSAPGPGHDVAPVDEQIPRFALRGTGPGAARSIRPAGAPPMPLDSARAGTGPAKDNGPAGALSIPLDLDVAALGPPRASGPADPSPIDGIEAAQLGTPMLLRGPQLERLAFPLADPAWFGTDLTPAAAWTTTDQGSAEEPKMAWNGPVVSEGTEGGSGPAPSGRHGDRPAWLMGRSSAELPSFPGLPAQPPGQEADRDPAGGRTQQPGELQFLPDIAADGAVRSASSPPAADAARAHGGAGLLVRQLVDGVDVAARAPGGQVRLRLRPDGMGSVLLRLVVTDHGVSIHMAVETSATRDLVQATWAQLSQALEARGLTVDHLLLDLIGGQPGFSDFGWHDARQGMNRPFRGASSSDSPHPENHEESDREPIVHRIDYRL